MFSVIKSDSFNRQIIGIADNNTEIYKIIYTDSGVQNMTQNIQTFTNLINYETKIVNFNDYLYNDKINNTFTHYQIDIIGDESYKYIKTIKKCVYEVVLYLNQQNDIDLMCCESIRTERDNIKTFSFTD